MGACGCGDCASDGPAMKCGKSVLEWAILATENQHHDRFWAIALAADLYERSLPGQSIPVDPVVTRVVQQALSDASKAPPLISSPAPTRIASDSSIAQPIRTDESPSELWAAETPFDSLHDSLGWNFEGDGQQISRVRRGKPGSTPTARRRCCVKKFLYPDTMEPWHTKDKKSITVGADFTVHAEFIESDDGCVCACCYFEQHVDVQSQGGAIGEPDTENGSSNIPLQEDCATETVKKYASGGISKTYSHGMPTPGSATPNEGDENAEGTFWYCYGKKGTTEERKSGYKKSIGAGKDQYSSADCAYDMSDSPYIVVKRGNWRNTLFSFSGLIRDVCNDSVVVAQGFFGLYFQVSYPSDGSEPHLLTMEHEQGREPKYAHPKERKK